MKARPPLRRRCPGCHRRPVPVGFCCRECWQKVPAELQAALYLAYQPVNRLDRRPMATRPWLQAARAVCHYLEGLRQLELFPAELLNRPAIPPGAPQSHERPRPHHFPA